MDDVNKDFGYGPKRWNKAKEFLRKLLWETAARQGQITYGEAADAISQIIAFHPHDTVFHHMLGQISIEEDRAGRGMLSALVVYKDGDGFPGPGFFKLAGELGRSTTDPVRFWVEEVKRLFQEAQLVTP